MNIRAPRLFPTSASAITRIAYWRDPGSLTLAFLALLHVLALVSFFFVLGLAGEAKAAEEACKGSNLLVEMEKTEPEKFRALQTEAAKVANGEGKFWKIEKPGIATSWLLGTMHVTDPAVVKMPTGAPYALSKANVVIIESDEIIDERKAAAGMMAKPELTMMMNGKSIQDFLSPDDKAKLDAALKERGIPLMAVSRMQPWMLSSFLALPACELNRKAKGAAYLDKKIADDATKAGIPVKGLETMQEQLSAMASIPVEFHIKSLIEMIGLGSKMDDVNVTMRDLYLTDKIGMTMPMLKSLAPDGTEGEGYAEFEERIVRQRNHTMAERALPMLNAGGAFMAVGALHLIGDEGLVTLLRNQGFTVSRAN